MEQRAAHRVAQIRDALPQFDIRTVEILGAGQNSDILVVNAGLVFRFPRHARGIELLDREAAILRLLHGQVALATPEPRWVTPEFIAYPLIPGLPLSACASVTLSAIASQLGDFLRRLHALPVEQLPAEARAASGVVEHWHGMYRRTRELLFPLMQPTARDEVARHFEAFLSDQRHHTVETVLVHGDLGAGNILCDPSGRAVTGVIDFSSARAGDAAIDLAAAATIGPDMLQLLSESYPVDGDMLDRVAFYRGTFALQEALFGIESGDEAALRAGLAGYR